MTDEKNNTPSSSGKGFGGFGDLVSDVSKDIESATRESSNTTKHQPKATVPSTNSTQHTTAQTEAPRANKLPVSPQSPSGSSGAKWLWGIGIVMVVLIGIGNSGKEKSPSYSPSTAYSRPSTNVPVSRVDGIVTNVPLATYSPTSKSGRDDSEIAEQLAKQSNFDLAGARKEGYTDQQIIKHLSSSQTKDAVDPKHGYVEFNGALDAPAVPNLDPIGHAPNGQPWPTKSGYLRGYKKLNTGGLSSLTIDNTSNDSNVYLKLFSLDGSRPSAALHVFIKAGDKFTFSSVTAGDYDVRYRDLRTGGLSKTDAFKLHEIYEDGGTRYSKMTMTLYKVRDGNMQMRNISESEF
jgi:hypothetical protein